jgi:glyoxylase-like metal-dependent hydrolase (beta-lactamase superfamily II)
MVGPPPPDWIVDPEAVQVFQVRDGLWSLRLPLPWPEISHVMAYVLEQEGGGVTLVDCGTAGHPSCWDALVGGLAGAGVEVADVRDLVLTHAHSDHLGLATRIVAESGCTAWLHPAHQAFSDGATQPERIRAARERRALDEGVPPEIVDYYASVEEEEQGALAPLPAFEDLRAGMRFPSRAGVWEVVETPGHTPSHVSLYQAEQGILIAGDLFARFYAPWFDYGYSDDPVAELEASLRAISALDVAVALPGHGRPIDGEDIAAIVTMYLEEIEKRLTAVEEAVAEGVTPAFPITRRVFGQPPSDFQEVSQFQETIAYLRHLRLTGRVVRERGDDGRFRYAVPAAGAARADG